MRLLREVDDDDIMSCATTVRGWNRGRSVGTTHSANPRTVFVSVCVRAREVFVRECACVRRPGETVVPGEGAAVSHWPEATPLYPRAKFSFFRDDESAGARYVYSRSLFPFYYYYCIFIFLISFRTTYILLI